MGGIKIISRPDPNRMPEFPLPLHIRSAGLNESIQTWSEYFPAAKKPFVQIFWTEKGTGEITLPGRKIILRAGDFFYHLPGDDHRHRTLGQVWNYRWFTMDGPLAEEFLRGYGYEQEARYAGTCPVKLFLELEFLLRNRSPYAQRHAISIAAEILALAGQSGIGSAADPVGYFMRKAEEHPEDTSLTAGKIAEELGMHRTTFTRQFKQQTGGRTPRRFLMEVRYERAVRMLRETRRPLKEIAQACGLANAAYLCRLIRQRTGFTPEQFRRNGRN